MKKLSTISFCMLIIVLACNIHFEAKAQTVYAQNMVPLPTLPAGFVSFDRWNPEVITAIPNTLAESYLVGGTWANGIWYGIDFQSSTTCNLYSIDPITGNSTLIGNTGVINGTGLSYDITTNTMYMLDAQPSDYISNLYTVDLTTGATTLIGSTNQRFILSLACDAAGDLYGFSIYYDKFFKINKQTAESTFIGSVGFSSNNANEMEFDRENDILFAYIRDMDQPTENQRRWWAIDTETGAATLIGVLQGGASALGMAIPYSLPQLERPQLIAPAHKSININLLPSFSWEQVANATNYKLEISTDKFFRTVYRTIENIPTNSYTLTNEEQLEENQIYYWRIKAFNDNNGTSWYSKKFSFRTISNLQTMNILLTSGWNIVSLNVIPNNPAMENIFAGMNNVVVVKNAAGDVFSPQFGINQIGNWNINEAYFVYTNASCNLSVSGIRIIPSETPLSLEIGWNLIPYYRTTPMNASQVFANINNYIVFAKNKLGGIYHPEFGINTIGDMLPNEGYWIYAVTPFTLFYQE